MSKVDASKLLNKMEELYWSEYYHGTLLIAMSRVYCRHCRSEITREGYKHEHTYRKGVTQ